MRPMIPTLALSLMALPAQAGPKQTVCHVDGGGRVRALEVADPAVKAHLRHGDHLPDTWYADDDGDGFGDADAAVSGCAQPKGYVEDDTDCDDGDDGVYPGNTDRYLDCDDTTWPGWVVHTRTIGKDSNIWAVRDDGSDLVQLTDGIYPTTSTALSWDAAARISPDGERIAIGTRLQPGGGDGSGWLWVADADGEGARPVRATGWYYGADTFSWRDDDHLLFRRHRTCTEDIEELDVNDGSVRTLFSVGNILWGPVGNPADPDEVLVTRYSCGSGSQTLQLVDVGAGSITPVPGLAPRQGFIWMEWFEDGSGFVYDGKPSNQLFTHDRKTSTAFYTAPAGYSVSRVALGQDDEWAFAQLYGSGGTRKLIRIDLDTGASLDLGVSDLARIQLLSWAEIPFDIDCDRDGRANGIDSTPGCPE